MPNFITKKTITITLLTLWVIFSLGYIVNDIWQDFKANQLAVAYNQARVETVKQIITEAKKCQPFSIYNDDQTINLVSVDCSKQAAGGEKK